MLKQPTLDRLHELKLDGMANAWRQQEGAPDYDALSFDDRLGLLVDAEWTHREQGKLSRRLRNARLRYPASLEDVEIKPARGLEREQVLSLGTCGWVKERHNLVITGKTGAGKSYLACAFAERACRLGFSALYVRAPRLLQDLKVAGADGSYGRMLSRYAKLDLLVIDDWLLTPPTDKERQDLLEIVEDRAERASTLLAGQLPVKQWHEAIGEPTLADAILDRLVHRAHRIELKGPSQREGRSPLRPSPKDRE